MDTTIVVAVVGLGVIALAVVLDRLVLVWKRRRAAWEGVAGELGLAVREAVDLRTRFGRLAFLQRGRRPRTRIALEGLASGSPVLLADYQYTTGAGRSQSVHSQTLCLFHGAGLVLPAFTLRREHGFLDRVGELLGAQDIDFPDDPAFSRAFVLKGEDESAVRSLFHIERRQRLLQQLTGGFHLEGAGDLLLFHTGRLIRPVAAREFLQRAGDLFDAFRR